MSSAGYQSLEFDLPASVEERLVGELWSAGTLGLEFRAAASEARCIVAYFAAAGEAAACAERLRRSCPEAKLRRREGLPDADWLEVYRRGARPFRLGRRLLVDPGDGGAQPPLPAGRRLLRLPARRAFGTGEHASTRLVVEWLEEMDLAGVRVLDVGCGSGILSLAAVLWGATEVTAIEPDPVAALVARDGQRLNRLAFRLIAGRAGCLRPPGSFDLLLVNVLPERIRPDLAALRRLTADGGGALFSGLPDEGADEVERRLRRRGFAIAERRRLDGWRAVLTRAAAPRGRAAC